MVRDALLLFGHCSIRMLQITSDHVAYDATTAPSASINSPRDEKSENYGDRNHAIRWTWPFGEAYRGATARHTKGGAYTTMALTFLRHFYALHYLRVLM